MFNSLGASTSVLHFLRVGPGANEPPGTVSDTFERELNIGRYAFALGSAGAESSHLAMNASFQFNLAFRDLIRWENAAGGVFQTGGNWSNGAPPSGTDNAVIDVPGSYTITLQGNAAHKRLRANGAASMSRLTRKVLTMFLMRSASAGGTATTCRSRSTTRAAWWSAPLRPSRRRPDASRRD